MSLLTCLKAAGCEVLGYKTYGLSDNYCLAFVKTADRRQGYVAGCVGLFNYRAAEEKHYYRGTKNHEGEWQVDVEKSLGLRYTSEDQLLRYEQVLKRYTAFLEESRREGWVKQCEDMESVIKWIENMHAAAKNPESVVKPIGGLFRVVLGDHVSEPYPYDFPEYQTPEELSALAKAWLADHRRPSS